MEIEINKKLKLIFKSRLSHAKKAELLVNLLEKNDIEKFNLQKEYSPLYHWYYRRKDRNLPIVDRLGKRLAHTASYKKGYGDDLAKAHAIRDIKLWLEEIEKEFIPFDTDFCECIEPENMSAQIRNRMTEFFAHYYDNNYISEDSVGYILLQSTSSTNISSSIIIPNKKEIQKSKTIEKKKIQRERREEYLNPVPPKPVTFPSFTPKLQIDEVTEKFLFDKKYSKITIPEFYMTELDFKLLIWFWEKVGETYGLTFNVNSRSKYLTRAGFLMEESLNIFQGDSTKLRIFMIYLKNAFHVYKTKYIPSQYLDDCYYGGFPSDLAENFKNYIIKLDRLKEFLSV